MCDVYTVTVNEDGTASFNNHPETEEQEDMANEERNIIQPQTVESGFDVRDIFPDLPDPEDTGDSSDMRLVLAYRESQAYTAYLRARLLARAQFHEAESDSKRANAAVMRNAILAEGDED